MTEEKTLRQRIRAGEVLVALRGSLDTTKSQLADIWATDRYDYIWIDGQHGPMNPNWLYETVKGLGRTDSDVIVRVVSNEHWLIGQTLDMGADGIVIPMVDNAEELRRAVDAAKYPPMGHRSNGARKTWRLGDQYVERANEETIVWPQIETKGAIDDIDAFLQVDGIDGIMIGPSDLALALGVPQGGTEVNNTFQFILDKCQEYGVPWGMFSGVERGSHWLKKGGQIVTAGNTLQYVGQGAAADLKAFKDLTSNMT